MKNILIKTSLIAVLVLTGCETSGLSLREVGSNSFSNVLYTLQKNHTDSQPIVALKKPITLAVAQIGETSPSNVVRAQLEKSSDIDRVIPLPLDMQSNTTGYFTNENASITTAQINDNKPYIQRLAKKLGADYIFLYGGNIDSGINATWATAFDFATLGLIIPSQELYMEGSATGVLIEAATGDVVFIVDGKDTLSTHVPMSLITYKKDKYKVILRDKVLVKLTEKFIEQLSKE